MKDLLGVYERELNSTIEHSVGIEKLKGKSVLVTGATGTIGSWIVATLLRYNDAEDAGITVYGTSRNPDVTTYGERKDFKWLSYELSEDIRFDVDMDYIIHAAGNAFPAMFYEQPVETIIGSVYGTKNILDYAKDHNTRRLLFISSGEVYGEVDKNVDFFSEDVIGKVDTLLPRSSYPLGKRMAENLCISYSSEYGVDTVIARCCHTFGPVFSERDNRANAQFIRKARNGEDIVLNSSGENVRSYLFVADCVSGIITVLTSGTMGEAYNVCDKANVASIRELAEMAAKVAGTEVIFDIKDDTARNATPIKKQIMDDTKLKELGWATEYSIGEGIKRTIITAESFNKT